jgi:hypothetical protein
LSHAFFAKIGACFSHDAETIITESISFVSAISMSVSSQKIASISENIIFAVTIAFQEPAMRGFLYFSKFQDFISVFENNSNAHQTHSSNEIKLLSVKFPICSKYFILL